MSNVTSTHKSVIRCIPHVYRDFLDEDTRILFFNTRPHSIPLQQIPAKLRNWILHNYPSTTHLRRGPTCGGFPNLAHSKTYIQKMQWWIGGYNNPKEGDKPIWEDLIYTKQYE